MEKPKKVWEYIDDTTDRMKVPGGWLYRTVLEGHHEVAVAMVFVSEEQ